LPDKDDPYLSILSEFVIGRAVEDWHNFIQHRAIEISINLPMIFFQDSKSVQTLRRQMPDHPAFEGLIVEIDAADVISNLGLAKAAARRGRWRTSAAKPLPGFSLPSSAVYQVRRSTTSRPS
jgi:EAL domain-containing protein (putative c-di-GMP-specific phosphodiesterase class I)